MLRTLLGALALAALMPAPAAAQVVYAWGVNVNGQLGNGTTTDSGVPVAVSTAGVLNGLTVTAVAGADGHSLAVANGKAYAWGYNDHGQLGNGTTTNSSLPVAVSTAGALNGLTVTAISGGIRHSLALANGKAYAWGFNNNGELGNNSTTDSSVPIAVSTAGVLNGLTVTAVSTGGDHSLAVANGKAYSWGSNTYGQLGNNSTTQSTVPVAVSTAGVLNGLTVTAVSAGTATSLAVANGKVYAWGYNGHGQLGNNSTTQSTVPVAVSTAGVLNGLTVTAVAMGGEHSLAVANGKVYAWGFNGNGQLGNGSTTDSSIPVAVSSAVLNGLTVTKVAAALFSSYALTNNGRLFSWGSNAYGDLGLGAGTGTNFSTPQEVFAPSGYYWSSVEADDEGYHVLAIATPVPEPGSLLVGLGLAGSVWRFRCRAPKKGR